MSRSSPIHPLIVPEIGDTVLRVLYQGINISMTQSILSDNPATPGAQDFDHSVLSGLLEIGDAAMREALCAQLLSDFGRMAEGLDEAEPAAVSRVAHELKGLAATIGARRLADMAQTLNRSAECIAPATLKVLIAPVQAELAGVMAVLKASAAAT